MPNSTQQILGLAESLVRSAARRKKINKIIKQRGFLPLGKGAWLGVRNDDIVSGLLIEGSPSDIYISSFVLPVFDELTFVSWGLGRRIVHSSMSENVESECDTAIKSYWQDIRPITTANELLEYLDIYRIDGFYSLWVRYLCYLRVGKIQQACTYLNEENKSTLHASKIDKFNELNKYASTQDLDRISKVFDRWKETSQKIFGSGNFIV